MPNITLAVDEETLKAGRDYASRHGTTLNQLVRDLLRQRTVGDRKAKADAMLRHMKEHSFNSGGRDWKREDLYDRKVLR